MKPVNTSVFDANSPQARAIASLFHFDLMVAGVIFLTVLGLIVYIVFRFRWRPGAPEPYQDHGNAKLETVWTVVPALVLAVLLVFTARTMAIVDPLAGSHPPDTVVIAHQWWWEYHYPQSGVITANELHMPDGKEWLLKLTSADVIHDFWVPDLGAKVDTIPGRVNYLWIQPQRNGTYLGTCAEFCGAEHAMMGIRVIVEPPAQFAAWEQSQLRVPAQPIGQTALDGARLFESMTCTNCHRIAGTKAEARVGPDLTHVADRQTLGAGAIENTLDRLTAWIENPQKIKPGCHMPVMDLTNAQAHDIAVYLEALK